MGVANRCSHWTVNRNQRRSHQQPHSVALVRASGFAGIERWTGDRTGRCWITRSKWAPTANMPTIQTPTANSGKVADYFLQGMPRPASRYKVWLKWGAYGLATGVSLARVGGKKH